jgi:cell division protein FtsI/penicillin-binding protein 2
MTQIFIGHRAGYGPALRILKDDNDDPITTPAADYEKFIFDSETNKLAYLNRLVRIQWDDTLPRPSQTGSNNGITTFYPPGSGMNTFEYAVGYTRAGDNVVRGLDGLCGTGGQEVAECQHAAYHRSGQ